MLDQSKATKENIVDFLIDLFNTRGQAEYLGEDVSQSAHMLQCAVVADQFDSSEEMILACLLHDVGHFLHDFPVDCADHGIDSKHETLGDDFLKEFYPPSITEPIRMHVDSKRYLCAAEEGYFDKLSPASVQSLELQGGPMDAEAVKVFESNPHYKNAVTLRRYEEAGKCEGVDTPTIESYRDLIQKFVLK